AETVALVEVGGDHLPRSAARSLSGAYGTWKISGVPGAGLAGKARRPRDRDRQARGNAVAHRGQNRSGGPEILRRQNPQAVKRSAGGIHRRDWRERKTGIPGR